jgi:glycosidase
MSVFGALALLSIVGGNRVLNGSENTYSQRRADWRVGAVIYQVFVDRFVPPTDLKAKQSLYPTQLHTWEDQPVAQKYDEVRQVWPHVLEFWGGDLNGVRSKLDYVQDLADVLYLTPIFQSGSNHKYDTDDYFKIDPQLGTEKDFEALVDETHERGMKLMLDGVFNHIGVTSPLFQEALTNPSSLHRKWFFIGKQYKLGYRAWSGVRNMPGWRLEDAGARNYLWGSSESVVHHYLHKGIDGWRLDVGFELGHEYLGELTAAAHAAKPGSWVVGEVLGYPAEWFPQLDGTFNFTMTKLAEQMLAGRVDGGDVGRMYDQLVADAGIDNLLKTWILTDNHDSARLAHDVPDFEKRKLVHALQLTLPGAPCLYYGTELGMDGEGDPSDRAPMRWDLVNAKNAELMWVKKLLGIRKAVPSLRYGDYKSLTTKKLLAFVRTTDRVKEASLVVMNPTDEPISEVFTVRLGRWMNWGDLKDQVSGATLHSYNGLLDVALKPHQVMILTAVVDKKEGYSPYNRIP